MGREIACVVHWVTVGTSGARWDMRLGVAQRLEVTRVAYSTSIPCQYHKKLLKTIEIHLKSMNTNENHQKSNGNSLFPLILYHNAWSSSRLAGVQGRVRGTWYTNACYSVPQ